MPPFPDKLSSPKPPRSISSSEEPFNVSFPAPPTKTPSVERERLSFEFVPTIPQQYFSIVWAYCILKEDIYDLKSINIFLSSTRRTRPKSARVTTEAEPLLSLKYTYELNKLKS